MPREPLPEDISKWPSDPFELLGVDREADALAIRRAYHSLIRKFKPEQFPDQFRRIREAFDACNNPYGFPFGGFVIRSSAPDERPAETEPSTELDRPQTSDSWDKALAGDRAGAYSELCDQYRRQNDAETARKLYWLLTVDPKLDEHRTRHDWLGKALANGTMTQGLIELYRRELEHDPNVLNHAAYENLFGNSSIETWQGRQLIHIRLAAAGQSMNFDNMQADLVLARKRFVNDDDITYLNMLTTAAETLFWDLRKTHEHWLELELATLKYLELKYSYHFDKLEFSIQSAVAFAKFLDDPHLGPMLDYVRRCNLGQTYVPRAVRDHAVETFCAPSLSEQYKAVSALERSAGDRPLANLVRNLLGLRDDESEGIPAEFIRGMARSVLRSRREDWPSLRYPLINEMLLHAVDPIEFMAAVAEDPQGKVRDLGTMIANDLSFQIIVAVGLLNVV